VRLRTAIAGDVGVSAMIQRRVADPVMPELLLRRAGKTLLLEVRYPTRPEGDLQRTDIAVLVPSSVPIYVQTQDGLIEGRRLDNDLRLESRAGNVSFSTTGTPRVDTVSGNVTAELLANASWDGGARLVSRSGNITLRLPDDPQAELYIYSRARVSMPTGFRIVRRATHRCLVKLGTGSQEIHLRATRGAITIVSPDSHQSRRQPCNACSDRLAAPPAGQ
jgi:hypothetical protein